MAKLLVKLDLETNVNVVKYIYPEWMTDEIKKKIINLSSTTPADLFVSVVIDTDDENEIALIKQNGGKELSGEQYTSWIEAKILELELLNQQQEEITNEPTS